MRQSITSTILDSWLMDEYEVVICQEESPTSLATRETLCSALEFKIAMISDDFEGLR
jgi:hypothetical protein